MMTLEEAIKHATEVSETCDNKECSLDHKQLASWLTELKDLREQHKLNMMSIPKYLLKCCAISLDAQHFSKYFGMLITEAKYGDMVDFEIIEKYKY